MNQTVTFHSPTFPASFAVEEEVVKELLSKAKQSNEKTASAYVNRLLKWALANYKEEFQFGKGFMEGSGNVHS